MTMITIMMMMMMTMAVSDKDGSEIPVLSTLIESGSMYPFELNAISKRT